MTDNTFQPLIAAHDFVSSRLIYFFNNDEFEDASFVMNEFEVFAIFMVTIAFIQDNTDVEQSAELLEQFHENVVERIVSRIAKTQQDEVSEEQEEALYEKILAIFQERLRLYFNEFKRQEEQQQDAFESLALTFIDNAIQETSADHIVPHFAAFASEIFSETVTLIKKSFEIQAFAKQQ